MNNQRVSVFRRKNRWGLTALCVFACMFLSPVLGVAAVMPQMMTMVPVALLALLGYVGPVSVIVCVSMVMALCTTLFGFWGALAAGIMLIPVIIVSGVVVDRERPFWQGVAAGCLAMFVSMGAVMVLLTVLSGSDVVTAISNMVRQAFEASGALGDSLLAVLAQLGIIEPHNGTVGSMDALARSQMVESLILMMDSALRLEIPMQMATGAVAAGLLGQAVLRKGLISRGEKKDYRPLKTWNVPTGWGRVLGLTLLALFVLAQIVPFAMSSMYYVFGGVFEQLFAIQGIAAVCYWLEKKNKSVMIQGLVFVLGYFMFRPTAIILGIMDQTFDFTRRRAEMAENRINPFDPRAV